MAQDWSDGGGRQEHVMTAGLAMLILFLYIVWQITKPKKED